MRLRAARYHWLALATLLATTPAGATPLEKVIPGLFGGSLTTTINQTSSDVGKASIVQGFTNLSAQLAAARSQVPLPSASGAFSYAWDTDVDSFVRFEQSLGAGFGERAQTLGKGRFNVGLSYQHVDFSSLAGSSLDQLVTVQPAFSKGYLSALPAGDQAIFADDVIRTELDMSFTFDMFFLSAAYGLTDSIDVSLALAVNHAHMQGTATAMTMDPAGNGGLDAVAQFALDQPGLISDGTGPICGQGNRCARATFNESATGTGDLYLRAKWHVADTWLADIALAEVLTVPTGNADELLGFHDPTFTPWFIASKTIGRVSPHLNLGYSFRSAQDVSQAQWIVGADVMAMRWLTLSGDFLGYHDDNRDGINDNVVQSAVGFKVNPWGGLVLTASFQFPLNTDGIRADVIYTGQVEYNF